MRVPASGEKERVIAIDYFRGICIIIILLSHSLAFSRPYAYLSGRGALWTSSAEMFFMLSGITFCIVRSKNIGSEFKLVINKSFKRARLLYIVHILAIFTALALATLVVGAHLTNDIPGTPPPFMGFNLLWQILSLQYAPGWSDFLMYYSIYLLIAPFALRALWSRYWWIVPAAAAAVYVATAPYSFGLVDLHSYDQFAIWQLYFFVGMAAARFREPIISRIYSLPKRVVSKGSSFVGAIAFTALALSAVIGMHFYPLMSYLTNNGWMPGKFMAAYLHLINHTPDFEKWVMNGRHALLRPIVTVFVMFAAYLFYQKHKTALLGRTGNVVNTMGRDTLWIFVAQAFAIPLLAAIPIQRNFINNSLLTLTLLLSMWVITQRSKIISRVKLLDISRALPAKASGAAIADEPTED